MKKLIVLFIFPTFLGGCGPYRQSDKSLTTAFDLPQIKDSGTLKVLTINDEGTSYFIYREQEMGYQYEVVSLFAQSLGLRVEVETARNAAELSCRLLAGEGDIIVYNLPVTKGLKDSLIYCGAEHITHQVIVQRNQKPLKNVTELIGKDIYVPPGKYHTRLVNLNNELGGGIHIHCMEGDSITPEHLIAQVSLGKIPYTVCDNGIARLNKTYYPNLNIDLSVSFDQKSSWAVRKNTPLLAAAVNEWYTVNKKTSNYTAIARRYFELSKSIRRLPTRHLPQGSISAFDHLFKEHAAVPGWDWRMLAAVAYTESNFDPNAQSWVGALGLMQLMPGTARAMGVPPGMENDPGANVKAAAKYLALLDKSFRMVEDKQERVCFILAAYNAGLGHIYDAMALTAKYGKNQYVWFGNVEHYLMLKSSEEYYTDPVCKYGYLRGVETYNFVRKVNSQFDMYQKRVKL